MLDVRPKKAHCVRKALEHSADGGDALTGVKERALQPASRQHDRSESLERPKAWG
jgi:hypothetical protein